MKYKIHVESQVALEKETVVGQAGELNTGTEVEAGELDTEEAVGPSRELNTGTEVAAGELNTEGAVGPSRELARELDTETTVELARELDAETNDILEEESVLQEVSEEIEADQTQTVREQLSQGRGWQREKKPFI